MKTMLKNFLYKPLVIKKTRNENRLQLILFFSWFITRGRISFLSVEYSNENEAYCHKLIDLFLTSKLNHYC